MDKTQPLTRHYYLDFKGVYGIQNDVLNSSENFRTSLKLLSDAFHRGLAQKIQSRGLCTAINIFWTTLFK